MSVTFPPEKEARLIQLAKQLQKDEGLSLYQIGQRFGIPPEWFEERLVHIPVATQPKAHPKAAHPKAAHRRR